VKSYGRIVSVTFDGWSAINGKAFLGVTLHFITNQWKLISIVAAVLPYPYPHNAKETGKILSAELKSWGVTHPVALVADNATTMQATQVSHPVVVSEEDGESEVNAYLEN
jgi:hypothetical protein